MRGVALVACLATTTADVVVGPFGPEGDAESRFMRRLRRDAVGPTTPAASAHVSHPTGLLVAGDRLFASEFRRDRVLVAATARAARGATAGWTVFADRGTHCRETKRGVSCGRLDGAWGLAAHPERELLFVSSFGSDEVLAFSLDKGKFRYALTGDLDCPEGLAVLGDSLYVASFLDSRLVVFDLEKRTSRTLALGPPVAVDYEALAFVPATFDEAGARGMRRDAAALWNDAHDAAPYVAQLRGPEQLVVFGDDALAVSSLHNDSVLEIDLATGALRRVLADGRADDRFSGPLGVAVADAADAALADVVVDDRCASDGPLLLVASYRSDAVSVVRRHCPGASAPIDLADDRLRGPTAIALDANDPGSLYVSAYEANAILFFKMTSPREEEALLKRMAKRME